MVNPHSSGNYSITFLNNLHAAFLPSYFVKLRINRCFLVGLGFVQVVLEHMQREFFLRFQVGHLSIWTALLSASEPSKNGGNVILLYASPDAPIDSGLISRELSNFFKMPENDIKILSFLFPTLWGEKELTVNTSVTKRELMSVNCLFFWLSDEQWLANQTNCCSQKNWRVSMVEAKMSRHLRANPHFVICATLHHCQ